ncbi:MAG: bifunctional 4-hydroxy-2-oxoglutarate aldolase/2-dehydro-3-deoxy-phosphogluconate aldolase [Spirochaetes bacterium]|nr:bifunctional 4-hydroxy-2-oxoglutarate aldolase/2-dehydro-3-deoxy-phosphogluconate aldolase [Spirochaetota bacterium]MBU0956462.1 bifunctional 4-hydroxy-2-oxoglutarate aldolase/2-dehydro-3-deoxy-phosphogluconate aldolase [Spirochaetota bacterium]
MHDFAAQLAEVRLVPVLAIDKLETVPQLMEALQTGGLSVLEITLRTEAALAAIQAAAQLPGLTIGAGTVCSRDQAAAAIDAGARFIVAPGFDAATVRYCQDRSVPIIPGCVTPTEIMAAMNAGLNVVKFFPASVYGGKAALEALGGPFPGLHFVPTGGIDLNNLAEYLSLPNVLACGGSWMARRQDVAAGDFAVIRRLAAQAAAEAQHAGKAARKG